MIACLTPGCTRPLHERDGAANDGCRGLCGPCYTRVRRSVGRGETTWAALIEGGRALENVCPPKQFSSPSRKKKVASRMRARRDPERGARVREQDRQSKMRQRGRPGFRERERNLERLRRLQAHQEGARLIAFVSVVAVEPCRCGRREGSPTPAAERCVACLAVELVALCLGTTVEEATTWAKSEASS